MDWGGGGGARVKGIQTVSHSTPYAGHARAIFNLLSLKCTTLLAYNQTAAATATTKTTQQKTATGLTECPSCESRSGTDPEESVDSGNHYADWKDQADERARATRGGHKARQNQFVLSTIHAPTPATNARADALRPSVFASEMSTQKATVLRRLSVRDSGVLGRRWHRAYSL